MQQEHWNRPLAALCCLALAFIGAGFLLPPRRVPPVSLQAQGDWQLENFAPGAVYVPSDPGPSRTRLFGSRVGGDATTGALRSPWYQVDRAYGLFVAGYPSAPGNRLELEVLVGDRREMIPVKIDAGEHWDLWLGPPVPPGGAKVRIIAVDGSAASGGWLGVSELVEARAQGIEALSAILRIVGTVALATALALGPGLCLRSIGRWPESPALVTVPGLFLLCGTGWCCWILARFVDPAIVSSVLLLPVLAAALAVSARTKIIVSRGESLTIGVYFTLIAIAIAKATWSQGPPDELYRGTISRTLEPGDRSDSRIPYHVVQLALHGEPPNGRRGHYYFGPWTFSHRGPLAGLAAAPVVALSGATVPDSMPDSAWAPFDPEGFAAYRIALIALAAMCVFPVLALAGDVAGELAGRAAVAAVSTAPFIVHELYFTWPKLLMATLILIAFWAVLRSRPGIAGLMVGTAYLVHPGALLSVPAVALAWPLRLALPEVRFASAIGTTRRRELWTGWLAFCAAAGVAVIAWRVVNGKAFQQGGFFVYFVLAGDHVARSAADWTRARLLSFADTVVPLWAWFRHLGDHDQSGGARAFFFQYWCTVPAGFGFVAIPFFGRELYWLARRFTTPFIVLVVLPFVLFMVFWGAPNTGLLREGLHAWVLVTLAACGSLWASDGRRPRWAAPLLATRAIEILGMTVAACLVEGGLVTAKFRWTDTASLLVLCGATALLARQVLHLMRDD